MQAAVISPDGRPFDGNRISLEKPEPPVWHRNDHGLKTEVSWPWTPIEATAKGTVRMWNRVYRLDGLLLTSAVSGRDELLDAPVCVEVECEGQRMPWSVKEVTLVEATKGKAIYRGALESAFGTLTGTATVEFDGFIWYELDLVPRRAEQRVDWGRIAVQMSPAHARLHTGHRYLHDPHLSRKPPTAAKGGGRALEETLMPFNPYVWVGDEIGGLAFIGEGMKHWVITKPNQVVELLPPGVDGKSAHIRVTFIDSPTVMNVSALRVVVRLGRISQPIAVLVPLDESRDGWQVWPLRGPHPCHFVPERESVRPPRRYLHVLLAVGRLLPRSHVQHYGQLAGLGELRSTHLAGGGTAPARGPASLSALEVAVDNELARGVRTQAECGHREQGCLGRGHRGSSICVNVWTLGGPVLRRPSVVHHFAPRDVADDRCHEAARALGSAAAFEHHVVHVADEILGKVGGSAAVGEQEEARIRLSPGLADRGQCRQPGCSTHAT